MSNKIDYENFEEFIKWVDVKTNLKFNPQPKKFPILHNCIYWAFMGCNIGSEEGKHRPILVTRTYKNSPICTIIPLTTKRLNDGFWYHVDLELQDSTALCEQMRIIDITRIDKPFREGGKIVPITDEDKKKISSQVDWLYKIKK